MEKHHAVARKMCGVIKREIAEEDARNVKDKKKLAYLREQLKAASEIEDTLYVLQHLERVVGYWIKRR